VGAALSSNFKPTLNTNKAVDMSLAAEDDRFKPKVRAY
jgi:hypothetical protein